MMKRLVRILGLVFLAASVAGVADAKRPSDPNGPPAQLYALGKTALPKTSRPLLPDAAEEFLIQVDPTAVAANPAVFLVDLPDYGLLEAVRNRFFDYKPDWKSWSGSLRYVDHHEPAGSIYIGFHGDRITALVELADGERYRIAGGPEEGQRLVRLSGGLGSPACRMDTPASSQETLPGTERMSRVDAPVALQTAALGTVRIDVLAVYPRAFFGISSWTESSLRTFVQDSISLANEAFANSGINAYYNLVGIVPILGGSQPATGLFSSLSWLDPRTSTNPNLSPPQEITDLRIAFGADVVTLFIPTEWNADDYCGTANQPLARNGGTDRFYRGDVEVIGAAMGDRAFSAHRYNCGLQDYTLTHEVGHNYGMGHHDDGTDPAFYLFPNGRGKVLQFPDGTKKATVMACFCTGCHCLRPSDPNYCSAGPAAVCNRIPYFSDPTKLYPNTNVYTGDPDRDNAAVGRAQVASYAALFPQSANTAPNVSFTVSCSGLTCTFNAGSTTDNTTLQSSKFFWYFGDSVPNTPTTGKVVSHSYTSAGSYQVHLVVKDSGGQTAVKGNTANPWVPLYEGAHETSNCGTIHGWAWDKTLPNTPISVDIYRDSTKVATVPANLFGSDLLSAGKGNGYHRFHYAPDSSWEDGWSHTVTVRFAGTTTNLGGTAQPIICNASINTTQTPAEFLATGGRVYSVATQFSSSQSGYITKLWFYRATGETGTNTLHLTTDSGAELASVPTNCPGVGWCAGSISPVAITAGTRYRVWVNTNTYQSKTYCGIGSGITNGPLTAHAGYWIEGNLFPNVNTCSNFFVDVSFYL